MVAFAHGARGADDGPDSDGATEGDERFFAQAAPDLVKAVLIVKVPERESDRCRVEVRAAGKLARSRQKKKAAGSYWGPTWWRGGGGGVAWMEMRVEGPAPVSGGVHAQLDSSQSPPSNRIVFKERNARGLAGRTGAVTELDRLSHHSAGSAPRSRGLFLSPTRSTARHSIDITASSTQLLVPISLRLDDWRGHAYICFAVQ